MLHRSARETSIKYSLVVITVGLSSTTSSLFVKSTGHQVQWRRKLLLFHIHLPAKPEINHVKSVSQGKALTGSQMKSNFKIAWTIQSTLHIHLILKWSIVLLTLRFLHKTRKKCLSPCKSSYNRSKTKTKEASCIIKYKNNLLKTLQLVGLPKTESFKSKTQEA